jgi:hypothetical protein
MERFAISDLPSVEYQHATLNRLVAASRLSRAECNRKWSLSFRWCLARQGAAWRISLDQGPKSVLPRARVYSRSVRCWA